VFASAVSCISLALSDAGIMLYDLVTACQTVSLLQQTLGAGIE
jgi:ribonuclease PH